MSERPVIGDFRDKTANNTLRPSTTAAPVPPEKASTTAAPTAPLAETTTIEEPRLSAAERYRQLLEQSEIPLSEAETIFDAVMTKGYYEEYVRFRKHRAVLRTRNYEDQLRLQTALELHQPRMALSQDELITRYNMAASLVEWDGAELPHDTGEAFDAKMTLIRHLPSPVFSLLAQHLARFDNKVMLVFSEGATENF